MQIEVIGDIVSRSPPAMTDEPYCAETEVVAALRKADPNERIDVVINSSGGSMEAGVGIYHALKSHPGLVVARVDGRACSAASLIMCGADRVEVYKNSLIMIHGVQASLPRINASNIKKLAADIEAIDSAMAEIYAARSGQPIKQIRDWMDPEKWMNGSEAIELGFADTLRDDSYQSLDLQAKADQPTQALTREEIATLMNDLETAGKALAAKCLDDKKAENDSETSENKKKSEELGDTPDSEPKDAVSSKSTESGNSDEEEKEEDKPENEKPAKEDEKKPEVFENKADPVLLERKRIQEIDAIANLVTDKKLLNSAKYGKNPMTAQELAYKVMLESRNQGKKFLNALATDQADSGVNEVESIPAIDKHTAKADASKQTLARAIAALNEGR